MKIELRALQSTVKPVTKALILVGTLGVAGCSHHWLGNKSSEVNLTAQQTASAQLAQNVQLGLSPRKAINGYDLLQETSTPSSTVRSRTASGVRYDLSRLQSRTIHILPKTANQDTNQGWSAQLYQSREHLGRENGQQVRLAKIDHFLGQDRFADEQGIAIGYRKSFVADNALGSFDVGITPRARFAFGPEGSATRVGALVSIGKNLREPRASSSNWYVFIGGGAEALTYEPGATRSLSDSLRLEEKTLVGDGQAGIAIRVGRANISLAYIRREVDVYSRIRELNSTDVENFAGLTLTFGR
ncbi:MAG: DUF2219 family protein [Robiginitomaculum sp.]|nr:DUF2219 family protein [Robiginitomaculum sp.]